MTVNFKGTEINVLITLYCERKIGLYVTCRQNGDGIKPRFDCKTFNMCSNTTRDKTKIEKALNIENDAHENRQNVLKVFFV